METMAQQQHQGMNQSQCYYYMPCYMTPQGYVVMPNQMMPPQVPVLPNQQSYSYSQAPPPLLTAKQSQFYGQNVELQIEEEEERKPHKSRKHKPSKATINTYSQQPYFQSATSVLESGSFSKSQSVEDDASSTGSIDESQEATFGESASVVREVSGNVIEDTKAYDVAQRLLSSPRDQMLNIIKSIVDQADEVKAKYGMTNNDMASLVSGCKGEHYANMRLAAKRGTFNGRQVALQFYVRLSRAIDESTPAKQKDLEQRCLALVTERRHQQQVRRTQSKRRALEIQHYEEALMLKRPKMMEQPPSA